MAPGLPPELEGLPPPSLVDELDYAATKNLFVDRLKSSFDAVGIIYDVDMLETDPGVILMEVAAYGDVNLRQRVNEAIRSWFLAYATGGDLDVLAQWYDVSRLLGESDDRLRHRIVLAIKGRSPGGTEDRYKFIAMSSDIRVADAKIYTVGRDPTVHVAVFSTNNGGVADAGLLSRVNAALQSPSVRMVNDTILVASAAQQVVNVAATVWLLPTAPDTVLAQMETHLRSAWARDMQLGRDLTLSWLIAQLQISGVHRVTDVLPAANIAIASNRAAALGTVILTIAGRDY